MLLPGTDVPHAAPGASLPTPPRVASSRSVSAAQDPASVWHVLLENTTTGARAAWILQQGHIVGSFGLGTMPTAWRMAGAGDFNADGGEDILWENTSDGSRAVWLLDGAGVVTAAVSLGVVPPSWHIAGAGDYNADTHDDILWENLSTGARAIWLMNGGTVLQSVALGTLTPDWRMVAARDLDSDGKADILLSNTTSGARVLWIMSGGVVANAVNLGVVDPAWSIVGVPDVDGDSRNDILWENVATGVRAAWLMDGGARVLSAPVITVEATTWHIAGVLRPDRGPPATPVTLAVNDGADEAAMAGQAVPVAPSVVVRGPGGTPMAGVSITFTANAGGVVTGASAVTNGSGVARVGGWTLGSATLNTLTATIASPGLAGSPIAIGAAGCEGGGGAGFAITLCYRSQVTTSQRAAFTSAAAKWGSVISGDLGDEPLNIGRGTGFQLSCFGFTPRLDMTVDDLLIFASIAPIDGAGNVVGQAGYCLDREDGFPVLGAMTFDSADAAALEANSRLNDVIRHEMGHVIGVGTLWDAFVQNPSSATAMLDTYFNGANAIAGFNAVGGTAYIAGQKVPVANTGGAGTINAHWRESVLKNELMTGTINGQANPLSVVTVRSLQDLGYTVNVSAADPYALTLALRSTDAGGPSIDLGNDVLRGNRYRIGSPGWILRIR